jgi:hypothetical protein
MYNIEIIAHNSVDLELVSSVRKRQLEGVEKEHKGKGTLHMKRKTVWGRSREEKAERNMQGETDHLERKQR